MAADLTPEREAAQDGPERRRWWPSTTGAAATCCELIPRVVGRYGRRLPIASFLQLDQTGPSSGE